MAQELTVFGQWAFIIGLIIAVLAGFAAIPGLAVILFVLGLVVGFLNIGQKETTSFLISTIALLMIGVSGLQLGGATAVFGAILQNFIAFVSAAALIVALKQILQVARPSTA